VSKAPFRSIGAILMALAMIGASASDPRERLADPAKEARARYIFKQLRCMMCQNESVDASTATQAADVRRTVRERIMLGDTDAQAMDYMEARFGEYILLKPPFSPGNLVLWLGPFAVVMIAGGAMVLALRRKPSSAAPLDAQEAQALEALLDENNAQIAPQIGRKKPASSS
jgi:cytochrome c-type biogenesis protein CcmH